MRCKDSSVSGDRILYSLWASVCAGCGIWRDDNKVKRYMMRGWDSMHCNTKLHLTWDSAESDTEAQMQRVSCLRLSRLEAGDTSVT